jgi:DNA-binding GntR family transcriptional regulator
MSAETMSAEGAPAATGTDQMSMTDRVYAHLREEILTARRKPGVVLRESDLAEAHEVSKTPVREALRLLARDGLVVLLPRKGYLVRPLELNDLREIFDARQILEPAMAERAATAPRSASLRELVDRQAAAGSSADALQAAREFHLAIADLAGNSRLALALSNLLDEVRRLHYLLPEVETHIASQEELQAHRQLIVALDAGDGQQAAARMREHIGEVARALARGFSGV